jgi:thioester reductase-like protein
VFLLRDLLELSEKTEVIVLVRAANEEAAKQRILNAFKKLQVPFLPAYHNRIQYVVGDLSKAMFGLTRYDFETLAEQVRTESPLVDFLLTKNKFKKKKNNNRWM